MINGDKNPLSSKKEFLIEDLDAIDDEYDTISSKASVKDAALKMKELGIPDLIVVDDNEKVLGVIADFDIVSGAVAEGINTQVAKVTDFMYKIEPVQKVTPVSVAFNRMRDLDVSVIPVIENDKLLGVATIMDCWGFLPEKYEDQKGLIAVSNPRLINFLFSMFMTIIYLLFGIFAPLLGITGFLKAPLITSGSYEATYYLFDAHGQGYFFRYIEFPTKFQLLGWGLTIYGFIFLILGLFSVFALYQWSYADYQLVKIRRNWKGIGFLVGLINLIIQWSIFLVLMVTDIISGASIDILGLILGFIAILALILAVSREYFFRETSVTIKED